MTPMLLPREVTATTAWVTVVWPGDTEPPRDAAIHGGPHPVGLPGPWQPAVADVPGLQLRHQRARLEGLGPRSAYQLALMAGGQVLAECRLSTLPDLLPMPPDRPFSLLLGSCFSRFRDPTGACGRAFLRLPASDAPDIAVLTGDQVYLDTPFSHFLLQRHGSEELAAEFASNYAGSWGQRTVDGGFGVLATGLGAFLVADDHELWNNAPNLVPHLPDTWTDAGRRAWALAAGGLYDAFQTPHRLHAFEVPPLSVRVMDTRLGRTADGAAFCDPAVLAQVTNWLSALQGPGILAVGQPLFVPRSGWRGLVGDRTLADFAQYADLVRALFAVRHDVVVLTGDVHFGRVATASLPSGARIIEIISSPMCLVDGLVGGRWQPPPPMFPADPIPGVTSTPIETAPLRMTENQFATVALTAEGGGAMLRHTAWRIGDGSLPGPVEGFHGPLH